MVVTASGGGCHEAPWAIAARIWKNFSDPIAAMKTTIAASMIAILLFTIRSSLTSLFTHIDAAILDQRSGRALHFRLCHPVVGPGRDLIELGLRQVVLAREHEEVGREPRVIPVALGRELNLGGLAARLGRFDPLPRGLDRGGGVQNLRLDGLPNADQVRLGLLLDV